MQSSKKFVAPILSQIARDLKAQPPCGRADHDFK